jgi:hypothetical protein
MTRLTHLLSISILLLLALQTRAQKASGRNSSFVLLESDSVEVRGDSTFIYNQNMCLRIKGIWDREIKRWIGTTYRYYENPCGEIAIETIYDQHGSLLAVKEYDLAGQLIEPERIVRNVLGLFPTKATQVNGFCFTFSHNKKRTINGLNIEFPGGRFTEYFIKFLSEEFYPERFASVNGVTISFNPIYKKVNGVGIFAFIAQVYEFNGLAIGPFNVVDEMKGLQLGLFNRAVDGRCVQIGLINTIDSNPRWLRHLPIVNMRFRRK